MRSLALRTYAIGLIVLLTAGVARAGATSDPGDPAASEASAESVWPHAIDVGDETILVHQPQVESWTDGRLSARAAVSIEKKSTAQTTYGVIWLSARTQVDKATRLVTLEDVRITKGRFPTERDSAAATLAAIGHHLADAPHTIALDRLEANLQIVKMEAGTQAIPLVDDPPRIFVSRVPALLVLVDGAPVLRAVPATVLLRVVNTRALIAFDPEHDRYYLWLANRWVEAASLSGPWTLASAAPASLDAVKRSAAGSGEVDLLDDAGDDVQTLLSRDEAPALYVSTVPAELLQIQGEPQLAPIEGTSLLEVGNTSSDIFVDPASSETYVLLSGRWFRAKSLDGPWSHVKPGALPAAFAKIPASDPKGRVLASVPGTPQAKEAAIANQIPQTAAVRRDGVHFAPQYDGAPRFEPIAGTSLLAAANTPSAVIEVAPTRYYGCENGVWFEASSPTGPWAVATSVPDAIYAIPPSSRLYGVTFVRVYDATPDVVYVGYTPGYYGSYLEPGGTVVYGTGYLYQPWIGDVWIGAPCSYGFGAGYVFGAESGFVLGFSAAVLFDPWWGPGDWGWGPGFGRHGFGFHHHHHHDFAAYDRDFDAYHRWGPGALQSRPVPTHIGVAAPQSGAQIFGARDGGVYRPGAGGWERHAAGGWQPLGRQQLAIQRSLDAEARARGVGSDRWNAFRSNAAVARRPPAGPAVSGSGFHAGAAPAFHGGVSGFRGAVGGFHGGGGGGGRR